MKTKENIKLRIIVPLFIVLALLLSVYLYALHWNQKQLINHSVNYKFQKVQDIVQSEFKQEQKQLKAITRILESTDELFQYWQAEDREHLYNHSRKIFENTLKKNDITHFYFIQADGTCFLRVHYPEFYGDKIKRYTFKQAVKTQKDYTGLELGPLGYFALRYVHPVKKEGKIIGYIELGEEINSIFDHLYDETDLNLYFLVYKKFLNKSKWQQGLKVVNGKSKWDDYKTFVLTKAREKYSLENLKDFFEEYNSLNNDDKVFFNDGNKHYCVKEIPFKDAANRTVGAIVVIDNITELQHSLNNLTLLLIIIGIILGAVLFSFFYFYLGHIENLIAKTETNLIEQNKVLVNKEKELMESNLKFQTISDNALDAIIMINNEGKVSYWNKAAERIFGYTEEEVMKTDMHLLLSPDKYHDSYTMGFEAFKDTGEGKAIGRILEFTAIKKDGSEFPIELSVAAIKIDNEWHAIGILRDISERKQLDKIRQNFIATLSHDLRVPLLAENHTLKYLLKGNYGDLTEKQITAVKNMLNSNSSQLNLVNILLDVYKLESDSLEMFKEPVEISTLVNESIHELLPLIETNNKTINSTISENYCTLEIDRNHIKRVLVNIISNAIDYTPDNTTIEVNAKKNGKVLTINIKDNGPGISNDELDKIFDRYYTSSKKFRKVGTGLGLYLSKQIILLHGGNIWVESELNKGTTFFFTLPI